MYWCVRKIYWVSMLRANVFDCAQYTLVIALQSDSPQQSRRTHKVIR